MRIRNIGVIVFLMLQACTMLSPVRVAPVQEYTLTNIGSIPIAKQRSATTLFVSTTGATPAYRSQKMLYSEQAHQLKAFTQNRWAAAPAHMLTGLIVQAIRDSQFFHAVVSPPIVAYSRLRLDTRLVKLQQEFDTTPSRMHIILDAQLIDNKTNRVIASKHFQRLTPVTDDTPYGGVLAANKALAEILPRLTHFVIVNSRS